MKKEKVEFWTGWNNDTGESQRPDTYPESECSEWTDEWTSDDDSSFVSDGTNDVSDDRFDFVIDKLENIRTQRVENVKLNRAHNPFYFAEQPTTEDMKPQNAKWLPNERKESYLIPNLSSFYSLNGVKESRNDSKVTVVPEERLTEEREAFHDTTVLKNENHIESRFVQLRDYDEYDQLMKMSNIDCIRKPMHLGKEPVPMEHKAIDSMAQTERTHMFNAQKGRIDIDNENWEKQTKQENNEEHPFKSGLVNPAHFFWLHRKRPAD